MRETTTATVGSAVEKEFQVTIDKQTAQQFGRSDYCPTCQVSFKGGQS